ncbi:hypothetical protein NT6N_23660 [Oceaniferula spumae]|uniref:Uncharacterized protein n=1 Tax=Oceaniferula spumae TaxID=2979115 RepID=A0AAT9FMV9_9BACT
MKILVHTLFVALMVIHSASAKLPAKRVDYLEVTYAGILKGEVYLRIINTSSKTISYASDGVSKIPIHYTDVWRGSTWNHDRGLRCATGRSVAELRPGEVHVFRMTAGGLRPVVGDKLRVRVVCRSGLKAEWTGESKADKFVSKTLLVTKKVVEQGGADDR